MTSKDDQLTPDVIRAACEATGWNEKDSSFSLTLLAMDCIRWFRREDVRDRFEAKSSTRAGCVYVADTNDPEFRPISSDLWCFGPPEVAWIKAVAWAAGRMGEGKK